MAKLTVKHTNNAIYAAAVLLLCAKAEYTAAQEQMRQQLALQGLASAGQTPYLAIHLMAQVDTLRTDGASYCLLRLDLLTRQAST